MLERYEKVWLPVQTVLEKLHVKEKNKKEKEKLANLRLSDDEKEKLHTVVEALGIVKSGAKRLCGNNVSLSIADRVSFFVLFYGEIFHCWTS